MLKAFTLGGRADSWASSISALPCLLSSQRRSWLSLGRGKARGCCHNNFVIDLGEGAAGARGSSGWPNLDRRGLWKEVGGFSWLSISLGAQPGLLAGVCGQPAVGYLQPPHLLSVNHNWPVPHHWRDSRKPDSGVFPRGSPPSQVQEGP